MVGTEIPAAASLSRQVRGAVAQGLFFGVLIWLVDGRDNLPSAAISGLCFGTLMLAWDVSERWRARRNS